MASRPEYVAKTRFSAAALALEQDYRWRLARQHNRFAHGWGVVCGLQVIPAGDPHRPWAVRICPGFALSPCGDEIDMRASLVLDIADWTWSLRTGAAQTPATAVIAVRYLAATANTSETVRVDALSDLVVAAAPSGICGGAPANIPAAATLYVPLARVQLSAAGVTAADIVDLRLPGAAQPSGQ